MNKDSDETVNMDTSRVLLIGILANVSLALICADDVHSKPPTDDATVREKPLIERKISIETKAENTTLALFRAAKSGDIKSLETLLAEGAEIDCVNSDGETPLIVAVNARKFECVKWLLSRGANANLQDEDDRSAVSIAAGLSNNSTILKAILQYGGDPNIIQRRTRIPGGYTYPNTTPLYDAIRASNRRNVMMLIRGGAKLDPEIDENTVSPLGWAIGLGQFDIAYSLVKAGADYRAPSLANDLTIIEALEDFDLSLIGVDEIDDRRRDKRRNEQTVWYYRVVRLLQEKGVAIRVVKTGAIVGSDPSRNEGTNRKNETSGKAQGRGE